jgi:glycerophosphoryl diester phosphodiesterase
VLKVSLRGLSREAPENTLPAIEAAVKAGADLIRVDVRSTKDDEPVLSAENRLTRIAGDERAVNKVTYPELKAMDAGRWFSEKFAGTRVPRLAEAVEACGECGLSVAVSARRPSKNFLDALKKALSARRAASPTWLGCSDSQVVAAWRSWGASVEVFLVLESRIDGWLLVDKSRKLGLKLIEPLDEMCDARLVAVAKEAGMSVCAHFTDEEPRMRELVAMGCGAIVTNRLDLLSKVAV